MTPPLLVGSLSEAAKGVATHAWAGVSTGVEYLLYFAALCMVVGIAIGAVGICVLPIAKRRWVDWFGEMFGQAGELERLKERAAKVEPAGDRAELLQAIGNAWNLQILVVGAGAQRMVSKDALAEMVASVGNN